MFPVALRFFNVVFPLRLPVILIYLLYFSFIPPSNLSCHHLTHARITVKFSGRFFTFSCKSIFHSHPPQLPSSSLECSFMSICRYMGFPLVDQPSTDISRYFYIASKFIENGINSGGKFCRKSFPFKKKFH